MAIKRYRATKDNTITNAFDETLSIRGTGSNMGQADILEVFSIYGQATTSSAELSRVLIQFDTSQIATDRTNGVIAKSGSVNFFLKLYNARHPETLPRNYKLTVNALSASWQEGRGLDMENYKDITQNQEGSNWINANGSLTAATLVDAIDITGHANGDKFKMTVPAAAGGDGVTYTFLLDSTTNVNNNSEANTFGISRQIPSDDAATAQAIVDAINGTANAAVKYGDADTGAGSTLSAGTIGLTAKIGSSASKITLTMDIKSAAGNVADVLEAVTGFENDLLLEAAFSGGSGKWFSPGGDYHIDSRSTFEQTFEIGNEDLELDVTPLVEQWVNSAGNVLGSKENYGFMIKLSSGSYEASSSVQQPGTALVSNYTKKFFARGTEYFFKQPVLEARWNSCTKDDRGNFYYSSSLAPAEDNLNTIYLYNFVRGRLRNIPSIDGQSAAGAPQDEIYVSIFSGSADDSGPFGPALKLSQDGTNVALGEGNMFCVTGGYVSTGVYSASFAFTGSEDLETIYDVWWSGSNTMQSALDSTIQFNTGSISPKTLLGSGISSNGNYIVSMPNLRDRYTNKQTERFRIYVRNKDWSPNVFTKVESTPETIIIESASYQITRVVDQQVVVSYGTGSSDNNYSMLSYDVSGNYFDFDLSMLEAGYTYGFQFSFYDDAVSSYRQQPYLFKFRVEKDEY